MAAALVAAGDRRDDQARHLAAVIDEEMEASGPRHW